MDDANKGPPKILNFILPNGNTYIEFKRDKKSFDEVIYESLYNANDTLRQQHKEDSVASIVATVNEDTITYQWESMQKSVTLPNIDIFKREYIDIIGLWGTLLYYGIYFTVLYNKSKQNKGVSKNAICMIFMEPMEPMGNGKTFDIQIYQKNVPDVEYLRLNHISLASNLINDQHKIEHFTIDSSEQLDIHLDLSRPIQQDMFIRKVDEGVHPVALKNPNFRKYLVGGNPSPRIHTGQRGGRFVMVGGRKRYLRK